METCVRGFSFMPDSKVDMGLPLQYIEGGELERAWRSTRRERVKQREQMIWDEFVKEKDVVKDVCIDDPYQFLDDLPESCLKEIMEKELLKMTKETAAVEANANEVDPLQQENGNNFLAEENIHTCVVTFADDVDKEDSDLFHIFDDDQSGAEEEVLNESMSPTTVRERLPPSVSPERVSENVSPERPGSIDKTSSKSSENVTNVIESSIYCAKVKDLRIKINEESMAMMTSLDRRDILSAEADDIKRMIKRSAEFCIRFNRIYMYQLQRQTHDVKRNNTVTLPFAKHTQFQSQMVRIVSLHQNILQSFQVLHKSFEQTCCIRESVVAVCALVGAARDATEHCAAVPPPKDFSAAADLYKDDLLLTLDKFEEFIIEYGKRCEEFLNSFENMQNLAFGKKNKEMKNKGKKRHFGPWVRNSAKTETDSKLSMYSLDNLRLNLNSKSSSSKDNQSSGTNKVRGGVNNASSSTVKRGQPDKNSDSQKSQKKSASRSRRPLMRDPHAGHPRPPRPTRDTDIRTMVEAVDTCASSHISREPSPHVTTPRRNKVTSPRRPLHPTPRSTNILHQHTIRKPHPPQHNMKLETKLSSLVSMKPRPRLEIQSPNCPKPPHTLKSTLSSIKSEQETVVGCPLTPVLKIQCAMKKELETDSGTKYGECSQSEESTNLPASPKHLVDVEKKDRERMKMSTLVPDRCEVTRLLKQLCSGDASGRTERITGAKNAQLLYVSGNSPRQPSTPQLLRILEETIQKKVPKQLFQKPTSTRGVERLRLTFNIADKTADTLFQYRTKFVQHMLTSALYANSAVGKPWEVIGSVSEQIIDELLLNCMEEMELHEVMQEMYKKETH